MVQIQKIDNKKTWEFFLKAFKGFFPFFQTWNWGEVQIAQGTHIERIGFFENKKLIGLAQIALVKAKRGTYFHLRHGPIFNTYKKTYIDELISYLSKKGKAVGASFIRVSPLISYQESSQCFNKKWKNAQIHRMDAEVCWVLPLEASEETLLAQMRKSHRYLIKKSQSIGVTIERTKNIDKLKLFFPLYTKLAHKKHFVPHTGITEELKIFGKDNESELFLAWYDKKVIAAALIDFVGNMAIYRHSASDDTFRHIPAMYFLQWKAILEAKKKGMKLYNFWGIAPIGNLRHPWHGVTMFKMGFGGEKMEFAHAKDYILSLSYWKVWLLEYVTRLKKGY